MLDLGLSSALGLGAVQAGVCSFPFSGGRPRPRIPSWREKSWLEELVADG